MARFSACGLAVQPSPRPWVAAIPFGNIVWENGAPVPYSQPLCSGEGGSPDWVSTGSDRPGDDPTRCSFAGKQARRDMFEGVIPALCHSGRTTCGERGDRYGEMPGGAASLQQTQ